MDLTMGFQVIEPPIYEELSWNMENIMKALEYIRQRLPEYLIDFPSSAKYYLIHYGDFLGNSYPAIGIRCDEKSDSEKIPSFVELYDRIQVWINKELTLERIILESKKIKILSWNELKEQNYFPENDM